MTTCSCPSQQCRGATVGQTFLSALILFSICAMHVHADAPSGRLAYPRDGAIYVRDLASGRETQLVKELGQDRRIEWSPDGKEILFWKRGESGWELCAIGLEGNVVRGVIRLDTGGAGGVAWSPDGSKIAYMRDQPQGLYVVARDGKDPKRLTHDGFRDERPAWSADGKSIVYQEFGFVDESARADAKFKIELYAVNADGSGKRKIVAAEGSSDTASFSPKGGRLLYRGTRAGNGEICVTELATGKETVLAKTPAEEYAPAWSPDGGRIAFWRDGADGPELWVMNADGSRPRKLNGFKDGARVERPNWSPDGKWLAYGGGDQAEGVWLAPSDGGDAKQVAKGCGAWARWAPRAK
jgi:Tol biopolymer transport system component